MENIGLKIKEYREKYNITQTTLANKLGVSKSVVSAYEKGIRNPSYDILNKLSDVFDIPVGEFFDNNINEIKRTLDVTGLSNRQVTILESLIIEFRQNNTY